MCAPMFCKGPAEVACLPGLTESSTERAERVAKASDNSPLPNNTAGGRELKRCEKRAINEREDGKESTSVGSRDVLWQ